MLKFLITFLSFGAVFGGILNDGRVEPLIFRDDYKLLKAFEGFYKLHNAKVSFASAMGTCRAEGADLWIPKSKEEISAIVNMTKPEIDKLWIGIHGWLKDNTLVSVKGVLIEHLYSKWADGHPTGKLFENCVYTQRDGLYYSQNCDEKYYFICKRSTKKLTWNSECDTYDLEYVRSSNFGKCYKFHAQPRHWSKALKICQHEQSNLAVVNGDAEAKYLATEFAKYPENKYIDRRADPRVLLLGFIDAEDDGHYETIYNKPLEESGYNEWADDELKYLCGAMDRNGKLKTVKCSNRSMYVCEKKINTSDDTI